MEPTRPNPGEGLVESRLLRAVRTARVVARLAASAEEPDTLLESACGALADSFGLRAVGAFTLTPGDAARPFMLPGAPPKAFAAFHAALSEGRIPEDIRKALDAGAPRKLDGFEDGEAWAVPLMFRGEAYGALLVLDGAALETEEERALIADAGADLAAGLHRLSERTERRAAERRYERLVDSLMGMVYQCRHDAGRTMAYVSAGARALTGYAPAELVGEAAVSYAGLIHPEDLGAVSAAIESAMQAGQPFVVRYRLLHRDGSVRWVIERGHALVNGDPAPSMLEGLITDVTEQVRREQQIAADEAKFRHVFEHSAVAKSLTLPDGRLGEVNSRLEELLGYTREVLLTMTFDQITHPDDLELTRSHVRGALRGEYETYRIEKRYLHKDGSVIWADVSTALIRDGAGRPLHFITAINDITERKRIEQALRDTSEQLQGFFEVALDLFVITDNEGRVLKLNRQWEAVLGYPLEQLQGALLLDFVHPDDLADTLTAMALATHDKPVLDFVNRYRCRDGSFRYIEWRAHPHGAVNYAAARDVTDRRAREEVLRESEARFRQLIEGAPEPIFVQEGGRFAYLNRAACALFGADSPEALVGQSVLERFHPDFRPTVMDRMRRLNEEHEPVPLLEETVLRLNGEEARVEVSAVPFASGGSTGALVFMHDLTLRKRVESKQRELEGQLQQAQKMESVGRLAGGVAHDFNNLLVPILGHAEILAADLPADHPAQDALREILSATERAREVAGQLLAFSRKKQIEKKTLNLNQVVGGFERMLGGLLGADVEVVLDLSESPLTIQGDGGQLEQILMNLAVNARDAMPYGGRLRIETAAVELGDEYNAERPMVIPGPYAQLCVTDTGIGMDAATRDRIFDPFFTTKEMDKGTGLGLSTVYGIVKQHDGQVWVYSEPGHGTTFKIYIPLFTPIVEHDQPAPVEPPESKPTAGEACVLVLEDLTPVRTLVVTMLKRMGMRSLEAGSLAEAQVVAKQARHIDLMISDVVLPDCKGPQAYEMLRDWHPGMKVIYMSGYTESAVAGHSGEAGYFLQKPFTAKALQAMVYRALAQEEKDA